MGASRHATEMVLQSNLVGRETEVRDRLKAYRDAGVTTLRLGPIGRGLRERLDALDRAMALLDEGPSGTGLSRPGVNADVSRSDQPGPWRFGRPQAWPHGLFP